LIIRNYKMEEKIGEGAEAEVFRVFDWPEKM
jgi:hypothetical protein